MTQAHSGRNHYGLAALAWMAVFTSSLFGYKEMWNRPWLGHADLVMMIALMTTLVVGFGVCISALVAFADKLPRLIRAGISAFAPAALFAAVAFTLGTQNFGAFRWPGLSGLAIALFAEYRMLIFVTIPLPVASCANAVLAFSWTQNGPQQAV
jgi:hypothetical protein